MDVQDLLIGDDGIFPGNKLPALLYKNILNISPLFGAADVKSLFEKHGWSNSWDAGIFTYHHYHSITHEVLGIYAGEAHIQLGNDQGPIILLEKGDVLIIPAGVAHKNLDGENNIGVVGAYPDGRDYDMNYGRPGERPKADEHIAAVPVPAQDPIGSNVLTEYWKKEK